MSFFERNRAIDTNFRINEQIRITPIRVVGHDGEMLGVIPTTDAMKLAFEAGLDLVEVAPRERPPVCRILDYGKFKYEQKKKSQKGTKPHQVQLKEVRLRPKIGQHDVDFKIRLARGFLEEKDKVKFTIQFRGRENAHHEMGRTVLEGIVAALEDVAKVEKSPSMEGPRNMSLVVAPK